MTVKLLFFQFLFQKMLKYITVKYYAGNEFAKESYQATEDSAAYDVFAAETKTFLPKSVDTLSLELRWAIPTGFYKKLFPHSGILKEHFVSINPGVIDANFRGIIQVLMLNRHPEKAFSVCTGDRIAQVVFMEKINANFHRVIDQHFLGRAKRGNDGFGLAGVTVIKKVKKDDDDNDDNGIQLTTSENNQVIINSEDNLQIIPYKSENELQKTSEEALMTINNEVVVRESITIDE